MHSSRDGSTKVWRYASLPPMRTNAPQTAPITAPNSRPPSAPATAAAPSANSAIAPPTSTAPTTAPMTAPLTVRGPMSAVTPSGSRPRISVSSRGGRPASGPSTVSPTARSSASIVSSASTALRASFSSRYTATTFSDRRAGSGCEIDTTLIDGSISVATSRMPRRPESCDPAGCGATSSMIGSTTGDVRRNSRGRPVRSRLARSPLDRAWRFRRPGQRRWLHDDLHGRHARHSAVRRPWRRRLRASSSPNGRGRPSSPT